MKISEKRHTIKTTHIDGAKLKYPIYWCGLECSPSEWQFINTHHLPLSVGGSIAPCKNCIKSIIKELEKEL